MFGMLNVVIGLFGLNRSLRWTRRSLERNVLRPFEQAGAKVRTLAHLNMPKVITNLRSRERGVKHRTVGLDQLDLLALLWQKCDFWDSLGGKCVIHGEPALMKAGCGYGVAERPRALARTVSEGAW